MKFRISGFIVGALINAVFWVLYISTGNVVSSIGVTAVVSIVLIETLRRLGKRKLK